MTTETKERLKKAIIENQVLTENLLQDRDELDAIVEHCYKEPEICDEILDQYVAA